MKFTKMQKFTIFISILYEVFVFLFSSVIVQEKNSPSILVPFLFLSLPCILYWGGVWIWGFGYLILFFKKIISLLFYPIKALKGKKTKHTKEQRQQTKLIKDGAENYGKWYTGWRSYPYYTWAIASIISCIILLFSEKQQEAVYICIGWIVFVVPLWCLSVWGYKWAMYAGVILFLCDLGASQVENYTPITIIYVLAVVKFFLTAIRIENYREKHKLKQKRRIIRDHLIAFVPSVVIMLVCSLCIYLRNSKELEDVHEYVGVIYRNTEGYEKYCLGYGYELKNYTASYYKKFSKKIDETNTRLKELDGSSIKETFDMIVKNNDLLKLFDTAIEKDMINYRKYLISSVVADHYSIPVDSVEWMDEYYEILSEREVCEFIDKNSNDIIEEGGIARLE